MTRAEFAPGLWLDSRRAVFFEAFRLLVVSDLHWGYATSHRARGNLLPDWGDDAIAASLDALLNDYQPSRMLWLGDSLHTLRGRLNAERFLAANAALPTTILPGNHDRRWSLVHTEPHVLHGHYFFHHGDSAREFPPGHIEVIGHHHPAFNWSDGAGARLKIPALVVSEHRLVLPAFSPWAAGAGWRLTASEKLWLVSPKRVFAFAPERLPARRALPGTFTYPRPPRG